MTMDVNHTPVRVDLRCALCQQKSAFICEHDTPYRDQYLGIFDSNAPRDILINRQGSKSEPKKHNNSISNGGMNTGREVNSNAGGGGGAQHQQQNINRQGAKSEPKIHNNSISNGGINKGQQVNSNAGDGDAQHQQQKKSNKTNVDPQHTDESSKIHQQDQKSKSCIIL